MAFNVSIRTHSNLLHLICKDIDISTQLHWRVVKFVHHGLNSDNLITRLYSKLAISGSGSAVGASINFICSEYGISKSQILNNYCKNECNYYVEDHLLNKAGIIMDFLAFRDSVLISCEDKWNVNDIVNTLCTEVT